MKPRAKNATGVELSKVENHYAHKDLEGAILRALAEAGKDPDHLGPEDLAPVDEFHVRGRKATLELARRFHLDATMHILDVGSGLGGPSRVLAQEFGCRVTGLDLSAEYCRVAAMLCRRLRLDGQVSYRHGNALDMPFENAAFDVVWTQHAAMNIPDKAGLYREIWRVLKPGGRLGIYDICAGEGGQVHFPVPWAREPSLSFLTAPARMREILEEIGFEIESWRDTTEEGRCWFRRVGEKMRRERPAALGLHLLMGADFGTMAQNQTRNLEEDRIALIEAVVRRPEDARTG